MAPVMVKHRLLFQRLLELMHDILSHVGHMYNTLGKQGRLIKSIKNWKAGDPQKNCERLNLWYPWNLHTLRMIMYSYYSCGYLIAFTCSLVFGVTPSMADWAIISVHMDTVNVLRWIRMAIHYAVVSTTTMLQTNSAIVIEKVETFTVWCIIILECL